MNQRLKIMIGGLIFSTLCFTIRYVPDKEVLFCLSSLSISGIYRVVELADGFHGRIVDTELYFGRSNSSVAVILVEPYFRCS